MSLIKASKNKQESLTSKLKNGTSSRSFARARSVRSTANIKLTSFITPMLASIHDAPFNDPNWLFEIKWDGYRAIAEIKRGVVKLYSRNGLSFSSLYPRVADELTRITKDAILDGEIIVLNENNKPDFQKLQQYGDYPSLPIQFHVFDCLSLEGKSLMRLPLIERKKIAEKIIPKSNIIKYSDHVIESGIEFFSRISKMDLEGMIAKRADSIYTPGKRTAEWLKIKNHNTQEAIIAGFTEPRGSRMHFGALILAIQQKGKLKYIGHTGTGFTQLALKDLFIKLQPLIRSTSPFDEKIPVNGKVTWVEPKLVCNIKFTEVTQEGILRHPVFQGLRVDKSASETNSIEVKAHTPAKNSQPKSKTSQTSKQSVDIKVGSHTVKITNPNKIWWPEEKISKAEVIKYYADVHQYILPYFKNRPQSLRRNPNGITDDGFFQKDAGDGIPGWVKTFQIEAKSVNRTIDYIICNNLATLLYLNNLGCIELNPWNSRINKLDHPDYMVLDIDPSDDNSFEEVIDTALVMKDLLDRAGASSYCKTSGATGLHIYVPFGAAYSYEQVRSFAELIATKTAEQLPHSTTIERALNKRNGRIYLDYLQNKKGQTLASVYSLRPKPGATVSMPLLWKEVKHGLHPSQFHIRNALSRVNKKGDLFAGVLKEKNNLEQCIKKLSK